MCIDLNFIYYCPPKSTTIEENPQLKFNYIRSANPVLGQTSERQTSEWTNVRVDKSEWQTSEKTKRQRRQTSEWDKRQRNLIFVKLWRFISSLRKMLILLFCWTKTVLKNNFCGHQYIFLLFFYILREKS